MMERGPPYTNLAPPSQSRIAPVVNSLLTRNRTACPTSLGAPTRPTGTLAAERCTSLAEHPPAYDPNREWQSGQAIPH